MNDSFMLSKRAVETLEVGRGRGARGARWEPAASQVADLSFRTRAAASLSFVFSNVARPDRGPQSWRGWGASKSHDAAGRLPQEGRPGLRLLLARGPGWGPGPHPQQDHPRPGAPPCSLSSWYIGTFHDFGALNF